MKRSNQWIISKKINMESLYAFLLILFIDGVMAQPIHIIQEIKKLPISFAALLGVMILSMGWITCLGFIYLILKCCKNYCNTSMKMITVKM